QDAHPRDMSLVTVGPRSLGPTAVLLWRHLATKCDEPRAGVELAVADTSQALGVGQRDGNSSPIVRTLSRLAQFDLACDDGRGTVAVRRNLPPINRRHVRRLPASLQVAHAEWAEAKLAEPPLATARRRARQVAFALLEQGDDADHVERVLFATGFHPSVCHEAARWAYRRHREAMEAARAAATPEPAA